MLPTAYASSTLELVGDVPPADGIKINHIEAMHILDSNPYELFFTTQNQGAYCGGGTPASVWKMTLDPNTGNKSTVAYMQSLSQIQSTRYALFESSDGTLFTGGGWCGYKPAYYSTDNGNTWQTADSGPVHPPNSVFSFAEFNGKVYTGTGYEPYPGQVYRWLGNGSWKLVLTTPNPRSIVYAMVAYDNQLFVGSLVYGYNGVGCESTTPVVVSPDGNTFNPTTGIPPCYSIIKLLVVDNQLVTLASNYYVTGESYMYRWNGTNVTSKTWEKIAAYNISGSGPLASHNGNIYAYGQAPGDAAAGIYQSSDLGLTWKQIAVLENPDASSMVIHNDTLYIGTFADTNNIAYIYRYRLKPVISVGSISGTKFNDLNGNGTRQSGEPGLANWTITMTNDTGVMITQTTALDGSYNFTNLTDGNYTVGEVIQPGWIQTAPAVSKTGSATYKVQISGGNDVVNKDFGNFKLGTVEGQKFEDLNANGVRDPNESGLVGWNITINGTDLITGTTVTQTTTTDANGNYNFTGLTAGTYTISETQKDGWVQTAPTTGTYTVTITSGANITGQDFGNKKKFSIYGMKFNDRNGNGKRDAGEEGLAGWHIKLVGYYTLTGTGVNREEITDANGNYGFMDVSPGIYEVYEVMQGPNWVSTTYPNVQINLKANENINVNFGNKQIP